MSAAPAVHPAPPLSRAFVADYVVTMRPYLLFVSGITGLVGLALGPSVRLADTLTLAVVFFLSYGFGQALTDCFQTDTDSLSSPYRPLVQGHLRQRDVLAVSLVGLLAGGVITMRHQPLNVPLALTIVVGLASYTWFKRRWWAGPFWNAWIVAALMLVAWLAAVGGAGQRPVWSPALSGALLAVFFGYANFVLTGYYKDISADRATGYHTLPVVFGTVVSGRVSDAFALLQVAGLILAWTVLARGASAIALLAGGVFLALGAGAVALGQLRLRTATEATAHVAIAPVVHGYILTLAGIAALARPAWTPALWLFYAGYLVALHRRPMPEQI